MLKILKLYHCYSKKIIFANKEMKYILNILCFTFLLSSCSTRNQLVYLDKNVPESEWASKKKYFVSDLINKGDILKVDISSVVPEASIPFNQPIQKTISSPNIDVIMLESYLVSDSGYIKLPVLGKIKATEITVNYLENKILDLLISQNHLKNPIVSVRRLNSKFTVLGEVRNPGTFNYYDQKLNLFQALGYAGDITFEGKKNDITLIRSNDNTEKVYKIKLNDSQILNSSTFYLRNNDVIIVNPSFNKIKSAGFIGSPTSITSIASLLLSISLIIINN